MSIRILAFGSRGDVQPFIALGLGLQKAGVDVSLATALNFKSFVESYGLPCLTTQVDLQQTVSRNRGGRKAKWEFLKMMLEDTLRLSEGADALIYSPAAIFSAPHVIEKLKIPSFPTALQPFLHVTDEVPAVGMPALPFGWYNRWTYGFVESFTWTFTRGQVNKWRTDTLDLPPAAQNPFAMAREQSAATLYGISPMVLTKKPEWGDKVHVTGYWFLPPPNNWQPPADLMAFLDAGSAPVYIGFGSMASKNPKETAKTVLKAVQEAGVRAILSAGWGGLSVTDVPENVFLVDNVPHEWLFPRMAAVVHHGGAGTTAAGLRAGVPTIVVPFKGDQPFWGKRVHDLGVGTKPIPHGKLTSQALAAALHEALTDRGLKDRAAAFGAKIRAEDGVGEAVRVITRALG